MSADELCWMPARELARRIRTREVSPVEVTGAVLARLARVDARVHAYCTVAADQALAAAREAEAALRRGASLGPLHGVPVSIKDLTPTRGLRTTMGSRIFAHHVPAEDAVLVERLRAAGAIVLGKTNTPEFGCKPFTDNRLFEPTRNPWALDRSPGGSSGGAAAAVAAGLGPLAEGSDLAGSIRHPAAWCGVVGFKPSPGRIPRFPAVTAWNTLSVHGPLARTVEDAALMFAVMAGADPRDPLALPPAGEDWLRAVEEPPRRALRLAWSPDLGGAAPVDPTIAAHCARAIRALAETLGWAIEEAAPEVGELLDPFLVLNAVLRQAAAGRYLDAWREEMDPVLVERLELARRLGATDVARAEVARAAYYHRLRRFFERYDLLVCPTTATAALPLDAPLPAQIGGRPIARAVDMLVLTLAFNFGAAPAISVPCGFTPEGLPVGLQLVAPCREDARVLQAAATLERAQPWTHRRPPLDR